MCTDKVKFLLAYQRLTFPIQSPTVFSVSNCHIVALDSLKLQGVVVRFPENRARKNRKNMINTNIQFYEFTADSITSQGVQSKGVMCSFYGTFIA
jgi:hypothetical protein